MLWAATCFSRSAMVGPYSSMFTAFWEHKHSRYYQQVWKADQSLISCNTIFAGFGLFMWLVDNDKQKNIPPTLYFKIKRIINPVSSNNLRRIGSKAQCSQSCVLVSHWKQAPSRFWASATRRWPARRRLCRLQSPSTSGREAGGRWSHQKAEAMQRKEEVCV